MKSSVWRVLAALALLCSALPRLCALSVSISVDTATAFEVTTNFTTNGPLTATGANGGTASVVVISSNELQYTVNSGTFGTDVFTFFPQRLFSNPLNLPILVGLDGSAMFSYTNQNTVLAKVEFGYGNPGELGRGVPDHGYTLPLFGACAGLLAFIRRRKFHCAVAE